MKYLVLALLICANLWSCNHEKRTLPFLGQPIVNSKGDTLKHSIANFKLTNEDGKVITNHDFVGKVYLADFFFTTCPTICPVMKSQMLRIYDKFKDNKNFLILSTTIDPHHDSVAVLKKYKQKLGLNGNQWIFATGQKEEIYYLAQKSYMVSAMEDKTDPESGGFVHSGAFVLVDTEQHVRGVYDGTKETEVNKLIKDIEILLAK